MLQGSTAGCREPVSWGRREQERRQDLQTKRARARPLSDRLQGVGGFPEGRTRALISESGGLGHRRRTC
jgi:hypothetical protein